MHKPLRLTSPLLATLMGLGLVTVVAVGMKMGSPSRASPSDLLHLVKSNPRKAEMLCKRFQDLNANGNSVYSSLVPQQASTLTTTVLTATVTPPSVYSPLALNQLSPDTKLTPGEAEIVVTYVIGLHCPGVQ